MYLEAGRIAVGGFSDVKILMLEAETPGNSSVLIPAHLGYLGFFPPLIS